MALRAEAGAGRPQVWTRLVGVPEAGPGLRGPGGQRPTPGGLKPFDGASAVVHHGGLHADDVGRSQVAQADLASLA
jgi:hypothetical protein